MSSAAFNSSSYTVRTATLKLDPAQLRWGGEGRAERGFNDLGSIDDSSSDNHSRILASSNLLLSAALPNEKAKMLCSLMEGDTGAADEQAMKRILDSARTKADWDDVMKGCSEYGWSVPDIIAELDRPQFLVDERGSIQGLNR